MIRTFYKLSFVVFVICLTSCTNNGLNKPITEELSVNELKTNLQNDTRFEYFYNQCRREADWISADKMRLAKYGGITYKKMWDANYNMIDGGKIDAQHLELFPHRETYHIQADSILDCLDALQPDSLIKLLFNYKTNNETLLGTMTEYGFLAVPLKGEVEQFSYYFYFSKKIDGIKTMNDIPYRNRYYGSHDSPIIRETSIDALGGLVDVLKDVTLAELKRDYYFIYTITNARYNGKNWSDIPYEIRDYLTENRDNEFVHNRAIELTIREYIDKNYVPYFDYYQQQSFNILKEKEPLIYDFYNEYLGIKK